MEGRRCSMRQFDYKKYKTYRWDNEILNYLSQIHEYKGKQELFLRQKPVEMEKLVEVAKVQSIESSNRIEGIITTSTRIGQLAKEKTTPKNRDEREIAGDSGVHGMVRRAGVAINDFAGITSGATRYEKELSAHTR